jgi:hypothetical protein
MEKMISNDGKFIVTSRARPFNGTFTLSTNADSAKRGVETRVKYFIDVAIYENDNGELGQVLIPSLSMRLMEARSKRNPSPSPFYIGADNDAPEGGNSSRRKTVKFSDSLWKAIKMCMGASINVANKGLIDGTSVTSTADLCIDMTLYAQASKALIDKAVAVNVPAVMPASSTEAEKAIQEFEKGQAGT